MMRRFLTTSFVLCVALFVLPAAIADVGDPLTLDIQPDIPVGAGDIISFSLTDGTPFHIVFGFLGTELGQFPLNQEVTLDLIPTSLMFMGFFDMSGIAKLR